MLTFISKDVGKKVKTEGLYPLNAPAVASVVFSLLWFKILNKYTLLNENTHQSTNRTQLFIGILEIYIFSHCFLALYLFNVFPNFTGFRKWVNSTSLSPKNPRPPCSAVNVHSDSPFSLCTMNVSQLKDQNDVRFAFQCLSCSPFVPVCDISASSLNLWENNSLCSKCLCHECK